MINQDMPTATSKRLRLTRARYKYRSKQFDVLTEKTMASTFEPIASLPQVTRTPLDQQLFDQSLKRMMPTIHRLINRISDNHADQRAELEQYALLGLWGIISQYGDKASPGLMFQAVKRAIGCAYNLDRHQYQFAPSRPTCRKYNNAIKDYQHRYGHRPTARQLADHMKTRINYVREYLLARANKFRPVEDYESASIIAYGHRRKGAWWYHRLEDYQNALIAQIDRRWIDRVSRQLTKSAQTGLQAIMSDEAIRDWSKRVGVSEYATHYQATQGLWWCRLLAEYRFRHNDPRDPRTYLTEQGYDVRQICRKKSRPTIDNGG